MYTIFNGCYFVILYLLETVLYQTFFTAMCRQALRMSWDTGN